MRVFPGGAGNERWGVTARDLIQTNDNVSFMLTDDCRVNNVSLAQSPDAGMVYPD